jgi:ATP-binding cassette subfamily C (CFTR/MRP) protein 10
LDIFLKIITEFLDGIRVIKFCSWEAYFIGRINKAREKELGQLRAKKYLDAGCVYFWASTPILMSVLTFITYVLLGNKLTPSKVFTSLALFNMLISPLNAFPWVINGLVQAWVSLKRVQSFLDLGNLNWLGYYTLNEQPAGSSASAQKSEVVIDIRNGEFKWKSEKPDRNKKNRKSRGESDQLFEAERAKSESTTALTEINVQIKRGELVGIIGKVGSGKSSLLHSIIAEIEKSDGKVRLSVDECSKGFAYVSQESWISAGSIRENILFGSEMNQEHYERVLEACALLPDLELFPKRDETPVGENGICLSGGQKARVTLARACYSIDKDIYILDDPLSAVDSHVAKHIFTHCINGLLAEKTRILCTHHFKYLINAETVLVMDEGRVVQSGRGADIVPRFLQYLSLISAESVSLGSGSGSGGGGVRDDEITSMDEIIREEQQQQRDSEEVKSEDIFKRLDEEEMKKKDEEEKEHGVINWRVYKYYVYSVGIALTLFTIVFLVMMQGKAFFCQP